MLDIFGKVFGQSKGNKGNATHNNGPTAANDQEGTRDSEQEDFVMVNGNGNNQQATTSATRPAMYPHLQLTNEVNTRTSLTTVWHEVSRLSMTAFDKLTLRFWDTNA